MTFTTIPDTLTDAAGRQQVSQPVSVGDYRFVDEVLSEDVSFFIIGTGGVVKNTTSPSATLSATSSGDFAMLQTRQSHPYLAGKAMLIEFTMFGFDTTASVVKRAGYFHQSVAFGTPATPTAADNIEGIWFENDGTDLRLKVASVYTVSLNVAQGSWNGDNMDGTGASGITLNLANFNVFKIEFLWLGGAVVEFSVVIGKKKHILHTFDYPNTAPAPITTTGQLPLTWSIHNTAAVADTFDVICATVAVMSENDNLVGRHHAVISGDDTGNTTALTFYPLIGIRLDKSDVKNRNICVFTREFGISTVDATAHYAYYLYYARGGLTITGTAPTWTSVHAGSRVEFTRMNENTTASTITAGNFNEEMVVAGGSAIGSGKGGSSSSLHQRLGAPADPTGAWDEIWVIARPYTANVNFAASINFDAVF